MSKTTHYSKLYKGDLCDCGRDAVRIKAGRYKICERCSKIEEQQAWDRKLRDQVNDRTCNFKRREQNKVDAIYFEPYRVPGIRY